MSDSEKSGAPQQAPADLPAPATAPAGSAQASSAASAPVNAPAAFGSFGATRGSGLLRGKRPTAAVAASASAPAGYKPTSLEVITSQTEYKNPFTGETSVSAPRNNEPAPPAAPPPSSTAAAHAPLISIARSPVPESSASIDAVERSDAGTPAGQAASTHPSPEGLMPGTSTEGSPKSELNILPPENAKRPALRWESNSPSGATPADQTASRPDDRRTFQPSRERREGREGRPFEQREPRQPRDPRDIPEPREQRQPRDPRDIPPPREQRSFEPREPRRDERTFEPRANQPYQERTPRAEPEKKSGGFIGWLKGIFGGPKTEDNASASPGAAGDTRRDGDSRHGGHRGGRGRGGQGGYRGENRGPRDPQQGQRGEAGPYPQGGEYRGEPRGEGDQGGHRRRRRRGGRGRFRGEGGGGGSDRGPRPEGQQGGGAI